MENSMIRKMTKSEAGRCGVTKSIEISARKLKERVDNYNLTPNKCQRCDNILSYKQRHNKFCSHSCSAINSAGRKWKTVKVNKPQNCLHCGKEMLFKRYYKKTFCNHTCQRDYQRDLIFKEIDRTGCIPTGVRISNIGKSYLISRRGYKCEGIGCGISEWLGKPITLQVDHKNGKSRDNRLINIQLLCPNCHSQTPNFGSKNKNSDRKYRREYYQLFQSSRRIK
jgi:hypothetical protein